MVPVGLGSPYASNAFRRRRARVFERDEQLAEQEYWDHYNRDRQATLDPLCVCLTRRSGGLLLRLLSPDFRTCCRRTQSRVNARDTSDRF